MTVRVNSGYRGAMIWLDVLAIRSLLGLIQIFSQSKAEVVLHWGSRSLSVVWGDDWESRHPACFFPAVSLQIMAIVHQKSAAQLTDI